MRPAVTEPGRHGRSFDDDRQSLQESLLHAREENLNLRDEVIGARAAVAQARKDHDATFYLLDVTTRQLNELKAALGYGPEAEVVDIVHAIESSVPGPAVRRPGREIGRR